MSAQEGKKESKIFRKLIDRQTTKPKYDEIIGDPHPPYKRRESATLSKTIGKSEMKGETNQRGKFHDNYDFSEKE